MPSDAMTPLGITVMHVPATQESVTTIQWNGLTFLYECYLLYFSAFHCLLKELEYGILYGQGDFGGPK
jgi:hypothetical protein